MKKLVTTLVVFAVLLGASYYSYDRQYAVAYTTEDIEQLLEEQLQTNVAVRTSLQTDNKLHVVFEKAGAIGAGEFSKGWNSKYKLEYAGFGTGELQANIVSTNKQQYLLLAGKSLEQIGQIVATIDDEQYEIDIPEQPYYLVLSPIHRTNQSKVNAVMIYGHDGTELDSINLLDK